MWGRIVPRSHFTHRWFKKMQMGNIWEHNGWLWSDAMNNRIHLFAEAPHKRTRIELNMCGRQAASLLRCHYRYKGRRLSPVASITCFLLQLIVWLNNTSRSLFSLVVRHDLESKVPISADPCKMFGSWSTLWRSRISSCRQVCLLQQSRSKYTMETTRG